MVALGRALMARPQLVLLDEPSMGLAPQIVEEIFEIIHQLNRRDGVSFLIAEQNINLALRYAQYGYVLESGRVVSEGTTGQLAACSDIQDFYLGGGTAGKGAAA
jgi:branched-chain amino acid transport system ATP-binding protein